jgi:hypothetical protein
MTSLSGTRNLMSGRVLPRNRSLCTLNYCIWFSSGKTAVDASLYALCQILSPGNYQADIEERNRETE